jgi:NAD-dependent deacetylase
MKNKILIFTGAGISAESGVPTFRTGPDGLWYNHKVEDVATYEGWKKDREKVLNFYNERRKQLKNVEPNIAHKIVAELEKEFQVTVVTQNVDNLHERAGSSVVIHLHGELTKSQSSLDSSIVYDCDEDIKIGDKCERGSQLRPHITWFGEDLDWSKIRQAEKAAKEADVCIIIGTSMQVAPANLIPFSTPDNCLIYYVDPGEVDFYLPKMRLVFFYHIRESASTGIQKVKEELENIYNIKSNI